MMPAAPMVVAGVGVKFVAFWWLSWYPFGCPSHILQTYQLPVHASCWQLGIMAAKERIVKKAVRNKAY